MLRFSPVAHREWASPRRARSDRAPCLPCAPDLL